MRKKMLAILAIISMFSVGITALAESNLVDDYDAIEQEKTLWCWAAVSEMMGYSYNVGSSPSQSSICYEIHGNYNNQASDGYEFRDAIKYASNENMEFGIPHKGFAVGKKYIDKNWPYTFVLDGGSLTSNIDHAIFVFGYYYTTSSDQRIYYVDPYDGIPRSKLFDSIRYDVEAGIYKNTWLF